MPSAAIDYARKNSSRFLDELKTLLRIPSVSTLPEHKGDVQAAADWLAKELKRIGMENVEVIATAGHPLVYADWLHAAGKPTALCYGHYDVQPPDPLDEWNSPPFEPTERDGNLYARGAVDDKGQMYMHVKAVESLFQANGGKLPINVRVLLEGEEEVGGEQIARFIREKGERLKADFALVSDTEMFAPRPAHALRRPARHDLHRDRGSRRENRSALRHVRGSRAQSLRRPRTDHRAAQGFGGTHSHSGFLRRCEVAQRRRAQGLARAAL